MIKRSLHKKNKGLGLQFKLMFVVFIGLLIGFIPLGIYSLNQAKEKIETDIMKSGTERVDFASLALSNLLIAYDYTNMESLADRVIQLEDVQKIAISKSDKLMTHRSLSYEETDGNLKHFEKNIYFDQKPIGKVEIWLSTKRHYDRLQNEYAKVIIILTLFAVMFGVLIYYTVSRAILKPIGHFRDSMLNIINNPSVDKKIHLEINKNDEIGELANIFNQMHEKVFEFQNLLKEKNVKTGMELKMANELLVQNSKMASLGEMAGNIAHEINNPLAIISAKTEKLIRLINENDIDKKTILTEIEKVKTTIARIVRIVKGLRTFSRKEDKDPFQKNKITAIFDASIDLCQDKLKANEISLAVTNRLDPNFEIECRESQIVQVIVNLISNALDAISTLPTKWIKLDAYMPDSQSVEISVIDSGEGIPAEIAVKIMEPFFTTKEKNKGTGLGLSISHSIATDHNGVLSVDRTCPNTRLVLKIPVTQSKS